MGMHDRRLPHLPPVPRSILASLIASLVLAVGGATSYGVLHSGSTTASRVPTVTVGRGDVVVTVGGAGHVVTTVTPASGALTSATTGVAGAVLRSPHCPWER